jgi:cytochrome c biogenesis protein CcmG, thiol:disulfide interchange protein DsbE
MSPGMRIGLAAGLLALLALLALGLTRDPRTIPSPLLGQPLPSLAGVTLAGAPRTLAPAGRPLVVNVWASWCVACLDEHPVLLAGAQRWAGQVDIVGLAYRDAADDARAWLARRGDPYAWVFHDPDGRAGVELGVYGVPETFFVSAQGRVLDKHVGALTPDVLDRRIGALLEAGP